MHRLIDVLLARKKPVQDLNALVALGQHCSERERRAERAERELTKVKLLEYMAERLGEELNAVVTGVEPFGLFVQGLEIPAEGLIHISSLNDDYYTFDRASHSLTGRRAGNAFRLGDPIRVAVAHVDVDRRVLDFRLVERRRGAVVAKPGREASPPPTSAGGRGAKKSTGRPKPGASSQGNQSSHGKKQSSGKKPPRGPHRKK